MRDTPLTRWSAAKPASLLHWGKPLLHPRRIFLLDPYHYFSQLIKADLKVKVSREDVLGRKIHGCSVEEKSCDLQSEGYPSEYGISALRNKENGIRSNQQKRCFTCPLHPRSTRLWKAPAPLFVWAGLVFAPNFLMEPGQSADKVEILYGECPDHLCSRYAVTAGIGLEATGVLRTTEVTLYSLVTLHYLIFGRRERSKIKRKIKFCSQYWSLTMIFLLLKISCLGISRRLGRVAHPEVKECL